MVRLLSDAASREEARIRTAYAKRRDDSVRYSCFNRGNLFIFQERERRLLALLCRHGFESLGEKQILEIGCGTGFWLREFIKWGAKPENITGMDLLADCIAEARNSCPTKVKLYCGSATNLDFPDSSFDFVLQSMVFTSILDPTMKRQVAREMIRVLKPNGLIGWYDYHVNNPWNRDVRGVQKSEILRLFPGCRIDLQRITLAPPVSRLLAPSYWLACYVLERIPWLCTHYLGVIRRGGNQNYQAS